MIVQRKHQHAWRVSSRRARAIQTRLAGAVVVRGTPRRLRSVAGTDVAFRGQVAHGVVVVLALPGLAVVEVAESTRPVPFPYVPGLLSFREAPVLLACFKRLRRRPQAVLVDGQGIAHPRRLGLASHLGLCLGIPTVGVAKSRLCGEHRALPEQAGATVPLMDGRERLGTVLRSKHGCRPLYISPGHRVSHAGAVALVKACLAGYRLPEPTRIADRYSKNKDVDW